MTTKICFIIPFYGKIPSYINLFLNSCKTNNDYTFLFFTDIQFNNFVPQNVKIINIPFKDLLLLIERKTGVKPNIVNYYKIVDFKPAYGLIFEDYIKEFDFWGMIDIDLILGRVNNFISDELLNKYDVISARKNWLSASFAIFRNIEKVNNLFKLNENWQNVFQIQDIMPLMNAAD